MSLLEVNQVKKVYASRFGQNVLALDSISFSVEEGEYVAIMGESGSGKTTLLNILATLDKPTKGSLYLAGKSFHHVSSEKIAQFRRKYLGFVFQDFHLLDTFNVRDNIMLPMVLSQFRVDEMEKRVENITRRLGIEELMEQYPYEISGGQKQRVAVARALIMEPRLILADEPTGALDSRAAQNLLATFKQINDQGQTMIMVTHSVQAAAHASRVLFIKDGKIYHQIEKRNYSDEQMYQNISETLTAIETRSVNIG